MPLEFAPPKYAVVVNAVQQRILDGTYPPGFLLPSESALSEEFNISRPTIVRSMGILRQQGWIDSEQGKGRFVKARPPLGARSAPTYALGVLDRDESADVQVLSAGPVAAPIRAATALGLSTGDPVIARRRLISTDEVPVELGTVYVPVETAVGTGLSGMDPIADGLLAHLRRRGVEFDHAVERISARPATNDEAELLRTGRRECLLSVLLTAVDRSGRPRIAVDAVMPATRHELEDDFPIR